jgi:hypothetical protein
MKADLSEIMWSIAQVSAIRRDMQGSFHVSRKEMECAEGLLRRAKTILGSRAIQTPLGMGGDEQ